MFQTRPLDGVLPIGEPVSVMVFLEDENKKMDVAVRDCWALPSEDFEDSSLPRVQLTSEEGCTMKEKLMGPWTSLYDNLNSGMTLISYSTLSAFKFPDYSQIYLTCNVEICQSQCERRCASKPTTSIAPTTPSPSLPRQEEVKCRPGSADIRCKNIISHESWCKSNRYHPKCIRSEEKKFNECPPGSSNPRCSNLTPACDSGSNDPRCQGAVIPHETCFEGSTNPICRQESNLSICGPDSTDERCTNIAIFVPDCSQTPFDPLCERIEIVDEITFNCEINPADARCIQSSIEKPRCYPGSNDPFCRTKTNLPKETSRIKSKICRPNSNDPGCANVEPSPPPPFSIVVPNTPLQVFCPPGSDDPTCSMQTQTLNCILNPIDPICSAGTTPTTITQSDKCRPGSQNPKCTQAHRESTFQTKPTSKPFIPFSTTPYEESSSPLPCVLGSKHPNCHKIVELPLKQLICEPGTTNPRCPNFIRNKEILSREVIDTPRRVECVSGSKNRKCLSRKTPNESRVPKVPIFDETTNFDCSQNPRDLRCKTPQRERPELSIEVSTKRPKISQIKASKCEIGSTDPNCVPRVPFLPEYAFECSRNSRDPRCQVTSGRTLCDEIPTDPRCYEERVPISPITDPRTFSCTPNSKDPRCNIFTTEAPSFTTQLLCLVQRNDPRCYQSTTEQQQRTKPPSPFNKNECYFRPNDPRCKPDSPSQSSSECKTGSSDPLCIQPKTVVSVITPAIKPGFPNVPRVPDETREYSPTRPYNPSVPFKPVGPLKQKSSEEIPYEPSFPNIRPIFPNIRPQSTEKTVRPEEPFRTFEKPSRPQRPRVPVATQVPGAPKKTSFSQLPYNSREEDVPQKPNNLVPINPRVPDIRREPDRPLVPDIYRGPDIPRVPDNPQVPDIPLVPYIPRVTDLSRVPNIPRPRLPDIPRVPDFPRVQVLPQEPTILKTKNNKPSIPQTPYVPQVSIIPQVPSILTELSKEQEHGNEQPSRFPKTDGPRVKVQPLTDRPNIYPVIPKFPSTERVRLTRPTTQKSSLTTPRPSFNPSSSEERPSSPFPSDPFSNVEETSIERPSFPNEPIDHFPQREISFIPSEPKEKEPIEPINPIPIQIPHFSVPFSRTTVPYLRELSPTQRPPIFNKVPKEPNQSDERTTRRPKPDKEFINSLDKGPKDPTTRRTPLPPTEKTKFVSRRPSILEERPSRPEILSKLPQETEFYTKKPSGPPNQPNLERGESKVSTRRPEIAPKKKRPMPDKSGMHGKDDHHGKGMDPRYHAFHSYLYQPAPRPRTRGRRELPETSVLVSVGTRRLTVVPEATRTQLPTAATSLSVDEGRLFLQDRAGELFKTFLLSDAEAFVEEVPINDDYDFTSYTSTETERDGKGDDFVTSENISNSVADYLSVKSTFQFIIAFSTITIIFITVMVITISTQKAIKTQKKIATLEL